jgi:hypothetical protein
MKCKIKSRPSRDVFGFSDCRDAIKELKKVTKEVRITFKNKDNFRVVTNSMGKKVRQGRIIVVKKKEKEIRC